MSHLNAAFLKQLLVLEVAADSDDSEAWLQSQHLAESGEETDQLFDRVRSVQVRQQCLDFTSVAITCGLDETF